MTNDARVFVLHHMPEAARGWTEFLGTHDGLHRLGTELRNTVFPFPVSILRALTCDRLRRGPSASFELPAQLRQAVEALAADERRTVAFAAMTLLVAVGDERIADALVDAMPITSTEDVAWALLAMGQVSADTARRTLGGTIWRLRLCARPVEPALLWRRYQHRRAIAALGTVAPPELVQVVEARRRRAVDVAERRAWAACLRAMHRRGAIDTSNTEPTNRR